mmetsp:Transcript_11050/g.25293  ORF Transcript_11050/g.25293 Transcript_11050/m.25293 type:complete len:217 (+) Transcript_11050:385-1035(+)
MRSPETEVCGCATTTCGRTPFGVGAASLCSTSASDCASATSALFRAASAAPADALGSSAAACFRALPGLIQLAVRGLLAAFSLAPAAATAPPPSVACEDDVESPSQSFFAACSASWPPCARSTAASFAARSVPLARLITGAACASDVTCLRRYSSAAVPETGRPSSRLMEARWSCPRKTTGAASSARADIGAAGALRRESSELEVLMMSSVQVSPV